MLIYSSLGFSFKQKYRFQMNSMELKKKNKTTPHKIQQKALWVELENILVR